jgi:GTP-binding protein
MQFIDQAVIVARSGAGGHGSRHFRREKHVPRGGPDGGDGGRGGDVVLVADERSRSLLDYHFRRTYAADDGSPGSGSRKTGRDGAELVLPVPPGTQVFDDDTGELLADLTAPGERLVLLRGGNGGWGNVHFATSTRQTPERANAGQPGLVRTLRFELKLLADVALVGFPNVGKSSLIRAISASQAKVADYPFTTLVPNLGVVRHAGRVFTVADIPGLVEGAAEGAGLGHRFLRHIERCQALVFLLAPLTEPDPDAALAVLSRELRAYSPELAQRPALVVLAKADLLGPEAAAEAAALSRRLKRPVLPVSPLTGAGIPALLDALASRFPAAQPLAGEPADGI